MFNKKLKEELNRLKKKNEKIKEEVNELRKMILEICPHNKGFNFRTDFYSAHYYKKCRICDTTITALSIDSALKEIKKQKEDEAIKNIEKFGYEVKR